MQMAEAFQRAREGVLAALKSTSQVLRGMQDEDHMKQHHLLRPKIPSFIRLKQFIREYAMVDILGKPEPLILRLTGWDDDQNDNSQFTVFLSTSDKYPDEANCQCNFRNQRRIDFTLKGAKSKAAKSGSEQPDNKQVKFDKQMLFICLEHSHDTQIRATVQFGADSSN